MSCWLTIPVKAYQPEAVAPVQADIAAIATPSAMRNQEYRAALARAALRAIGSAKGWRDA